MGRLLGIARRDRKRAPMEEVDDASITPEGGLDGDFRGRPGDRQVTLLSAGDWQAACSELGRDVPWTVRRSNLLIGDVALPKRAGAVVEIGAVRLVTTMEVDPCSRMDEQVPGLRHALLPGWRGGVACRVLAGGRIAVGDEVRIIE